MGSQGYGRGFEPEFGRGRESSQEPSHWGGRMEGGSRSESRYSNIFDQERSRTGQQTQGRFRGKGPKGFMRSDERIREDVCEKLEDADEVDASEISVEVKQGEVVLTGTTDSRWAKRYAEDCAYQVRGVKNVRNELQVQESSSERTQMQGSQQEEQGNGQRRSRSTSFGVSSTGTESTQASQQT